MPKSVSSEAELIEMVGKGFFDMEGPVTEVRDYARTLMLVACCGDMVSRELSSVLYRLSCNMQDAREQIEERREELLRLLPHRHKPGGSDRDDEEPATEPAA